MPTLWSVRPPKSSSLANAEVLFRRDRQPPRFVARTVVQPAKALPLATFTILPALAMVMKDHLIALFLKLVKPPPRPSGDGLVLAEGKRPNPQLPMTAVDLSVSLRAILSIARHHAIRQIQRIAGMPETTLPDAPE